MFHSGILGRAHFCPPVKLHGPGQGTSAIYCNFSLASNLFLDDRDECVQKACLGSSDGRHSLSRIEHAIFLLITAQCNTTRKLFGTTTP